MALAVSGAVPRVPLRATFPMTPALSVGAGFVPGGRDVPGSAVRTAGAEPVVLLGTGQRLLRAAPFDQFRLYRPVADAISALSRVVKCA